MNTDMAKIGARIRSFRIRANLSQEALGEAIGVSRNFIGLVENGHKSLSIENTLHIIKVLNITPNMLLSDDDSKSSEIGFLLANRSPEITLILSETLKQLDRLLNDFEIKPR